MKTVIKIALVATIAMAAGAKAMAQNNEENPLYGNTPEERKENLKALSFLRDEANMRNWRDARGYVKHLMNAAPKASVAIYQYGAMVYKGLAQKATSVAEKKSYIDSLMLIYDRRIEHFGDHPTQGTPFILEMKARDYLFNSPLDREGVRRFYREAVDKSGDAAKPEVVLEYFRQLVLDYKDVKVSPEDLYGEYERLSPLMEKGTEEEQNSFTGLFATSGAADCGVLEDLYTKQLAEKPGDADLLAKAYGMMSAAGCDSDFYLSVAEQYYAASPSSNVAIRLAMAFENKEQFDKALQYLSPQIESETNPAEKANLYVRVAASELGLKRNRDAAQAARQAIALDSGNGYAHSLLAEAYIGGASQCGGFNGQTVFWLAADELIRAREACAGDAAMQEKINSRLGLCRANFPTKEDGFMTIQGYAEGKSYTVSCGWVSGTTSIRSR